MWFGPFAAHGAALDGLLQPYHPPRIADVAAHDSSWRWFTLDYQPVGVIGSAAGGLQDLASVRRLAVADPERSEMGMGILLSMLDRARQIDGDVERAWTWWQQRARSGLVLIEDDRDAAATVRGGEASHALSLLESGSPLTGLAPIPNAIGLAASARNVDGARRLLDWLADESGGTVIRLSPWQAASNGLEALLSAAPPLDVDWCRQQYTATRRRWAQSGFGPAVKPRQAAAASTPERNQTSSSAAGIGRPI
jgi:ABC-type Fe3+ transport system substrate-binding protein